MGIRSDGCVLLLVGEEEGVRKGVLLGATFLSRKFVKDSHHIILSDLWLLIYFLPTLLRFFINISLLYILV